MTKWYRTPAKPATKERAEKELSNEAYALQLIRFEQMIRDKRWKESQ